jgi:hypothetical protein
MIDLLQQIHFGQYFGIISPVHLRQSLSFLHHLTQ